ncbi:MAG TPA: hypothetical protein VNJ12_00205 [Candidatus Dormibacteraeota bacterium]|nr:hypothetical protein [Candidatus Dormibacteraeota bacterium]
MSHDGDERPREREQRPPESRPARMDRLGPKTPRMVGTVLRTRCSNCGAVLAPGFSPAGQCSRCQAEFHSCKQCAHFDTGARFECTQPIPERIPKKDALNDCTFFEFRMTVEKDTSPVAAASVSVVPSGNHRPNDARKAFEDLFKK